MNNFAKVCRLKTTASASVNVALEEAVPEKVERGSDMDDNKTMIHVVHSLLAVKPSSSQQASLPRCQIVICEHQIVAVVDTGASINLLAAEEYDRMVPPPTLTKTSIKVYAYGQSTPLALRGMFQTNLTHGSQSTLAKVYVTDGGTGMLLGCKAAEELAIVTFAFSIHQESVAELVARYEGVFNGIGCLRGRESSSTLIPRCSQ
ncbi:hypothetical protein NDU88_007496 [Pleurodeles waltl]|uniref:Uncharacterized protein n=1 Tax=Pleurodeles waltl TaxID=8319 RepID=A0AAV7U2G4_PLEWA|nr:hypothetical protein NDU88_007496 [Pleurodeles waltl]